MAIAQLQYNDIKQEKAICHKLIEQILSLQDSPFSNFGKILKLALISKKVTITPITI